MLFQRLHLAFGGGDSLGFLPLPPNSLFLELGEFGLELCGPLSILALASHLLFGLLLYLAALDLELFHRFAQRRLTFCLQPFELFTLLFEPLHLQSKGLYAIGFTLLCFPVQLFEPLTLRLELFQLPSLFLETLALLLELSPLLFECLPLCREPRRFCCLLN